MIWNPGKITLSGFFFYIQNFEITLVQSNEGDL